MSTGPAHHAAAASVKRAIADGMAKGDRGVELGIVRAIGEELTVELENSSTTLVVGDDFVLTQTLEWWDHNYGIAVDDVLVLLRTRVGSWMAVDVHSSRPTLAGIRMNRPAAAVGSDVRPFQAKSEVGLFTIGSVPSGGGTPSLTWNHHIVAAAPVYDETGALVGYVPVFGTLPT